MTRNRQSAKTAGTRMETLVARYLAETVDERVERRRLTGTRDRGDLTGLRHMGGRLVVEVKNTSRWTPAAWLAEAETARGNDDALAALVVTKQRGATDPAKQVVLMTLGDLAALLTGSRGHEAATRAEGGDEE